MLAASLAAFEHLLGRRMKVGMWVFCKFSLFLLLLMVGAKETNHSQQEGRISGGC